MFPGLWLWWFMYDQNVNQIVTQGSPQSKKKTQTILSDFDGTGWLELSY